MGFIEDELKEVRNLCVNRVVGSRLIACTSGIVRVEISKTKVQTLSVTLRFSPNYPSSPVLIELTSKRLGDKFLTGLTNLCEEEVKKKLGKAQILILLEFIRKFIDDHPLCSCSGEIARIKQNLLSSYPFDETKLKQKSSTISLTLREAKYTHKVHLVIPENYPDSQVRIETKYTDYSGVFQRYLQAQSLEIARRAVEPPANKKLRLKIPFEPKPSLYSVVEFLVKQIHVSLQQNCAKCGERCFPENPSDVIHDELDDRHVERVYCDHLYHLNCLLIYMKTPPFIDGKKCLAQNCGKVIYHEKYKVSAELSESRWVHQQAREREIEEVVDFFA